jgi:hypothetical protein
MPAGVFLVGDEEASGIKTRVGRLMELAASKPGQKCRREAFPQFLIWVFSASVLSSLLIVVNAHLVFSSVHSFIEQVVFVLR